MQNFKTLVQPLTFGGGSCGCCCYHMKVKSTPSFGLAWEFDKNVDIEDNRDTK
jgi:hypothetical protein